MTRPLAPDAITRVPELQGCGITAVRRVAQGIAVAVEPPETAACRRCYGFPNAQAYVHNMQRGFLTRSPVVSRATRIDTEPAR